MIRFTPTRVGNTFARQPHGVHEFGSPPRAWGIQQRLVNPIVCTRFTPTRVGNTMKKQRSISHGNGSPPRAWGIPD